MTYQEPKAMQKDVKKMLSEHQELTHSQMKKVLSHVQRKQGEWYLNTILIEECDVPFKYKRRKEYKSLKGARVNLTYYPTTELVAGIEMDVLNVVRIRRS